MYEEVQRITVFCSLFLVIRFNIGACYKSLSEKRWSNSEIAMFRK
jgi:hypothetical protein